MMRKPIGEIVSIQGRQLPIREAWRVGNVLYLSGQLAFNADLEIVGDDVRTQMRQVMDNIGRVLAKGNSSIGDIFKVTAWLRNIEDFPAFNGVYEEYFASNPPARTTVRADLMAPGALVELEVQACLAADPSSI